MLPAYNIDLRPVILFSANDLLSTCLRVLELRVQQAWYRLYWTSDVLYTKFRTDFGFQSLIFICWPYVGPIVIQRPSCFVCRLSGPCCDHYGWVCQIRLSPTVATRLRARYGRRVDTTLFETYDARQIRLNSTYLVERRWILLVYLIHLIPLPTREDIPFTDSMGFSSHAILHPAFTST